jgi:hypothetical protein
MDGHRGALRTELGLHRHLAREVLHPAAHVRDPEGRINRVRIARRRRSIDTWTETAHLPESALDDE